MPISIFGKLIYNYILMSNLIEKGVEMSNFNYFVKQSKIIIKLDGRKNLLKLDESNITFIEQDGYIIIIHSESTSYGIAQSKEEAYISMVKSKSFIKWYNKKIAETLEYEIEDINLWITNTKLIDFMIKQGNQWVKVDERFFDYYLDNFLDDIKYLVNY
jgi:hypothetical protein